MTNEVLKKLFHKTNVAVAEVVCAQDFDLSMSFSRIL